MNPSQKTLLLYQRPVALRQDLHHAMRLAFDAHDFLFASSANSFLLAATEIAEACLHYPIVFVEDEAGAFSLAVMVGLGSQQNLFVEPGGDWMAGAYVPAFVRRYPFVLLEEAPGQLAVGFDAGYPGFRQAEDEAGGVALFAADGSPSPLLRHAIHFLEGFHAEMAATRAFADKLASLALLVPRVVEVSSGLAGAPSVTHGIFVVDADKLAALPAEQLAELAAGPYLGWIYLHLNSLRLVQRLAARIDALRGGRVSPVEVHSAVAPNGESPTPRPAGRRTRGAKAEPEGAQVSGPVAAKATAAKSRGRGGKSGAAMK